MGYQTEIGTKQTKWIAGMISEAGATKVRTKRNGGTQINTVTVTAVSLATVATINSVAYAYDSKTVTITAADTLTTATVNGTAYTVNAAGGTLTKAATATALAAAITVDTLATAVADDETVIVTSVKTAITVVGTANCTVAQTTTTKTGIATGLTSIINTYETDITAESEDEVITIEANEVGTAFTAVGTTNCTVVAVETIASTVGFGLIVVRKDNGDCGLPDATGDITINKVCGMTIKNNVIEDEGNGYEVGDMIDYLTNGTGIVQIPSGVTVNEGDTVYVIYTGDDVGKVSNVNTNATALTGVKFLETASEGLANIQINLP